MLASAFLPMGVESTAFGSTAGAQRDGGIFRISINAASGIDYLDPALASTPPAWALLDTTCARLLSYPDKANRKAFRLQPEVAESLPTVSRDGKTYTFRLRSGYRFSDGTPVRASAFAREINRLLAPRMNSPGVQFARDIVGAGRVVTGKADKASGVSRTRKHTCHSPRAPRARLPEPYGVDVLLRRSAVVADRPGRGRRVSGCRPLLRFRLPAWGSGAAAPQ